VSRHAKAPSAGSNSSQAAGLGSFLRGVFATRGTLGQGKGSGAPAARRLAVPVAVLAAAVASVALTVAPASAVEHLPLETFGSAAQPSFGHPQGMAVDQSTGNLLVIDGEAGTVSRYNSDGTPVDFSALGTNVIDGVGAGDETPEGGLSFEEDGSLVQVAVDNSGGVTDGNIYVTQYEQGVVDIFAADGTYLSQLTGSNAGAFEWPVGVTADSDGSVYVSDFKAGTIHKFVPSSNPPSNSDNTANFAFSGRPANIAAGAGPTDGSLFAVDFDAVQIVKLDSATGARQDQFGGGFEGRYRALAVDPASGRVYIARQDFTTSKEAVDEYSASTVPRLASSTTASSAIEGVAVNGARGDLYLSRAGNANVEASPAGPLVPAVENEGATGVDFTEATLRAEVNPEGSATTYHFEYGTDTSYGTTTAPSGIGSDKTDHPVSLALNGLVPGTDYHWRVVATNAVGTTEGTDHVFSTHGLPGGGEGCPNEAFRTGASAGLPDCRAYEMVTPVDKNNGDIFAPLDVASNQLILDQAATSGEKLTYTTSQGFGDTVGVPITSQYIASRGAGGWSSHSITPPQGISPAEGGAQLENLEFRAFTTDLCSAALLNTTASPLAPGAVDGFFNIYKRHNCGQEGYEAITTTEPPNVLPKNYTGLSMQGLSADGRCVVFRANDQLTPDANPGFPQFGITFFQVYESCGDGQLHLVSMLPSGEASPEDSSAGTGIATVGGGVGFRYNTLSRAVSADGSRVYWTESLAEGPLYLRENSTQPQSAIGSGGECTEADKACTIPVSSGTAHFWSASSDGSKALYSEGNLENVDAQLYEFDLASKASTPIATGVKGVMGASEDASRIAFVSKEILTAGANAQGQSPATGQPNLYLFDSTRSGADRYRFIGTLSKLDASLTNAGGNDSDVLAPISLFPYRKTSRVSPDGTQLAFMSTATLTGYDNSDANNGRALAEVFAYDATANGGQGQLRCVSCNPSGQRPVGRNIRLEARDTPLWSAALLPTYYTDQYGSRVISDDGKRVYFNAYDALLPSDTNGKADVYQWEAPGSGSCTEASPAYSPLNEGCVSLISTGESVADSEFVDASPDGRDVFFTTGASLLPQDPGLIDIYDARAGGGYPPPPGQPAACEGEACQGPLSPPNDPTPASAAFNGPGNVREAGKPRCRKGKARRKGRCVATKKSKHAKKRSHRAADNNRRTAR
jgi:hypothetical protein